MIGITATSSALLLLTMAAGLRAGQDPPPKADPFQLALTLRAARSYCRRLERAAMDFVCMEEISERIDPSRDNRHSSIQAMPQDVLTPGTSSKPGGIYLRSDKPLDKPLVNAYVFDYQYTRQAGALKENRKLLSVNGRKANNDEVPSTLTFRFKDILLAPVQLLAEQNGEYYEYRLLREDRVGDEKAWVLDVRPRLNLPDRYLGAQVWLRQADASVLRIDWDPTTFGKYENILARAKAYKSEPRVASFTEFGSEKNGLRFPSVDETKEAYIDKDGKIFLRAVTRVEYKAFKFFTVETESEIKKGP
jgi:hypothetical protein